MREYVLRTDAQITQMMDCRSPDASQCFSLPHNATWDVGRGAARNVDADGSVITRLGVHGCANLPSHEWSDMMDGPVPYQKASCPVAFSPREPDKCKRYANTDTCASMIVGQGCWPGAGSPKVDTYNASDPRCWRASPHPGPASYCANQTKGKSDVYGPCGGRSSSTCCAKLKCFHQSADYGQCCLAPDMPKGCASWARPPDDDERVTPAVADRGSCGVQYVSIRPGYAVDELGRTTPESADRCNVTVDEAYSDPKYCNALPAADKVCNGLQAMKRIDYSQYGRSQWECRVA